MTNVNGINYTQQVAPTATRRAYIQQTNPQYYTYPIQNDTFVSSEKAKENKKSGNFLGKTLLTAAVVIGGAVLARKFTG